MISELNEEDLAAVESDAEDYTASTESNLSSCSESAGKIHDMHPRVLRADLFLLILLHIGVYSLEQQLSSALFRMDFQLFTRTYMWF